MPRKREELLRLKNLFLDLYIKYPDRSLRELAKFVGVSHTTVRRWRDEFAGRKEPKKKENRLEKLYLLMPENLRDRLREMILIAQPSKGRSKTIPKKEIYRYVEADFIALGVKDEKTALKLISYFVEREFGSWENLEQKRRNKKERLKYRTPKGTLKKYAGQMAIDATGTTALIENGEQVTYSIFLACDVYSGYVFPLPLIVSSREKPVRFYNKAFNSRNTALWLINLFSTYGVPQELISDNDPVLKNDYIDNALSLLNIKRTFVKHPGQNPIEREIRDLKDKLVVLLAGCKSKEEIYEKVRTAIERYNITEHKFSHFNRPHIPEEVFSAIKEDAYTKEEEDRIRRAFMEVAVRVVQNNKIQWGGYVYEFIAPPKLREGDYGRKPKALKVLVMRHVDNASYLEVYHPYTKEPLGTARLISSDVPTLDPVKREEIKSAERRAREKERKLTKEIEEIRKQVKETVEEITKDFRIEEEEDLPQVSVWEILSKSVKEVDDEA